MNFLILLFLIIYSVAGTPISSGNNNQRIIGGSEAYSGQFPYQAIVRHSDHLQYACGGSVVSDLWVLTSASCIELLEHDNKMRIVVGSIYINSGGATYTVLISRKHPNFDGEGYVNDIGLIRVNGYFIFTDYLQPIQLYSDFTPVNLPLTITGWGATSNIPGEVLPNILQYATVWSMSLVECMKLVAFPLVDSHLCTHASITQGPCVYDNGSPLVYNGQQHAVLSMTFNCLTSVPDLYTRVAPFRNWIKEITNA